MNCPYANAECAGVPAGERRWQCPVLDAALTQPLTDLCRTKPKYYEKWKAGHRPGQTKVHKVLHLTIRQDWQDIQRRSSSALNGDQYAVAEMVKPTMWQLRRELSRRQSVVFIHAGAIGVPVIEKCAKAYGNTQFVFVNHSSLSHTYAWPAMFKAQRDALNLSDSLDNVWCASPDIYAPWMNQGHVRYRHFPNPVYLPEWTQTVSVEPPVVLLVGRDDLMKSYPAQLAAVALVAKKRPLQCAISVRGGSKPRLEGLKALAESLDLEIEEWPYGNMGEWYDRLQSKVSVVMQATLLDSFNYISVDAASMGRPFVGSFAIKHTPAEWTVRNTQDVFEIANVLEHVLDNYDEASSTARKLAERVATYNNSKYCEVVSEIVSKASQKRESKSCGGCGSKKKALTLMGEVWDVMKAVGKFVGSFGELVSKEEYQNRLDICSVCENRGDERVKYNPHRCGECGCFVAVKAQAKAWQCPIGKWNKETVDGH